MRRFLANVLLEMAPTPMRVRRAEMQDRTDQTLLERDNDFLARKKLKKADGLLYRSAQNEDQLVVPNKPELRTADAELNPRCVIGARRISNGTKGSRCLWILRSAQTR